MDIRRSRSGDVKNDETKEKIVSGFYYYLGRERVGVKWPLFFGDDGAFPGSWVAAHGAQDGNCTGHDVSLSPTAELGRTLSTYSTTYREKPYFRKGCCTTIHCT